MLLRHNGWGALYKHKLVLKCLLVQVRDNGRSPSPRRVHPHQGFPGWVGTRTPPGSGWIRTFLTDSVKSSGSGSLSHPKMSFKE